MYRIYCRFYGLIWHKVGIGRANNSQKICRIKSENLLPTENKVYFFNENLGLSRANTRAIVELTDDELNAVAGGGSVVSCRPHGCRIFDTNVPASEPAAGPTRDTIDVLSWSWG